MPPVTMPVRGHWLPCIGNPCKLVSALVYTCLAHVARRCALSFSHDVPKLCTARSNELYIHPCHASQWREKHLHSVLPVDHAASQACYKLPPDTCQDLPAVLEKVVQTPPLPADWTLLPRSMAATAVTHSRHGSCGTA